MSDALLMARASRCQRPCWVQKQNTLAPDRNVKEISATYIVEKRQFRKIVFEDGTTSIAPKGYLCGGSNDNGDSNQGLNRLFTPKADNENGGFILNANYIDYPSSFG